MNNHESPKKLAETVAVEIARKILADTGKVRGCPGKYASKIQLRLRVATTEDAEHIEGWLSQSEVSFLGGDQDQLLPQQVRTWINDALGAYVLQAGEHDVAFMTLEHNDDTPDPSTVGPHLAGAASIEFGRLVVRPGNRRKGYGTSLLIAFYSSYLAYIRDKDCHPCCIFIRTTRDNDICLSFLAALPVTLVGVQSDLYIWHTVCDVFGYHDFVGQIIATYRNTCALTQQRLSFLACIDASVLAMIETGQRSLKLDDARRLLALLCKDEISEFKYAKSILGCRYDPGMWTYREDLAGELQFIRQTLWVFSNALAERASDDAVRQSGSAIIQGYDRVFFVPPSYRESDIDEICRRFIRHFKTLDAPSSIIGGHLRFYRAPESLCVLRVAVHDPNPNPNILDARKISIGTGRPDLRVEIAARGDILIHFFLKEIKEQMVDAENHDGPTEGGFQRLSIDWSRYRD